MLVGAFDDDVAVVQNPRSKITRKLLLTSARNRPKLGAALARTIDWGSQLAGIGTQALVGTDRERSSIGFPGYWPLAAAGGSTTPSGASAGAQRPASPVFTLNASNSVVQALNTDRTGDFAA